MSLKSLAAQLQLSPTTVSRALNGYPEVNEATRRRVAEAAKRLGYAPNMRARALATGRAMAIGHVLTLSGRHELVNPVFADFIMGAGEIYARNGYDLVLHIAPDDDDARAYRDLRAKGNVDGVIVHAPRLNDPRIALLTDIGLPFVLHGRAEGVELPYSWTDVNNLRAFRRATDFLLDLGHRRIALINGPAILGFAQRRRAGFVEALAACGIAPNPDLIVSGPMTEALGAESAAHLLDLPDPPTAFLTASLLLALGVRRTIEGRGLRMGRDVSVLTFDDDFTYLKNGGEVPMFTATRSSVREAGGRAAQMLLDLIASHDPQPRHDLLEAELIVGQSTGPAPAAGAQP
ncbi:LacI family DNA-binding transcriptional regulator [Paracoccus sp. p3-h83]|uniref:LacI family DNA-binding transcriptional regulator n=1 Tax=Paracoccus sp. p3-h83 TaxID=3342805 RepID=UPI0035B8CFBD